MTEIKELDTSFFEEIKELYRSIFAAPPWNEIWLSEDQLNNYMLELLEVRNPLVLGFYENERLIGVSIGKIRHWNEGTEYFIEEVGILAEYRGRGYGSRFFDGIEAYIRAQGVNEIFLLTKRQMPAYEFYKKRGFQDLKEYACMFREF